MLNDHKIHCRVERDECGDPCLDCRPTNVPGVIFDGGRDWFELWIDETRRPQATGNAIVRQLAAIGVEAAIKQCGDSEVIVRIEHGGDLRLAAQILTVLRAHRRRRLSQSHREVLVKAGSQFRFQKKNGSGVVLHPRRSKRDTQRFRNDNGKEFGV